VAGQQTSPSESATLSGYAVVNSPTVNWDTKYSNKSAHSTSTSWLRSYQELHFTMRVPVDTMSRPGIQNGNSPGIEHTGLACGRMLSSSIDRGC
jgi:hypothetical protein